MTDTVDFVLQLLDTALKAREYIQDFRNAPNGRQKLVSEMEDLQRLLKDLRARITANPSSRIIQQMNTQLTALKYTMEELTRDLRPGKGQIARFARQLTLNLWNKKEGGGYLVEFERFKLLLDSWLMLDICHWIRQYTGSNYNVAACGAGCGPVIEVPEPSSNSHGHPCDDSLAWGHNASTRMGTPSGGTKFRPFKLMDGTTVHVIWSIGMEWGAILNLLPGTLKGSCAAASTLCGMSWGSPPNRAIFYQTEDNVIHQMSCFHGKGWHVSSFAQADAMPGTHMAEVHSEDAGRVVLFFQDKDGFLCSRCAIDWRWEDAVRLWEGAAATPISATTWSHTEDIRGYFQDEDNALQEFRGSFNGGWRLGEFIRPLSKIHRSMAAISWFGPEMKPGPEIRVYIQDDTNIVIEWSYSVITEWSLGQFKAEAPPDADIAALRRNDAYVHVYWTSYDKIVLFSSLPSSLKIHQKVWTDTLGWLTESLLCVRNPADYRVPSIESSSACVLKHNNEGAFSTFHSDSGPHDAIPDTIRSVLNEVVHHVGCVVQVIVGQYNISGGVGGTGGGAHNAGNGGAGKQPGNSPGKGQKASYVERTQARQMMNSQKRKSMAKDGLAGPRAPIKMPKLAASA
ncbi:hypothetical protein DFH08DRAFT_1013722 [Mycena albidolilacea]|uniref:Fucose-specific lectin n=1 Tax=Mycena albidolilacea TaxID=1033008 RepID=A0AAD6ZUN7_9AGAR|nr:hypothetical protein DFH08DRAFT_1013722 [Mycena albidolilacea]